jgi:predicted AlkP superfamily phosphohydrolase/phosphomutase
VLAVLQFDSPALPLLEEMLSDGRLPTLAGLRERGRWETVDTRSVVLQSSTYPTLCTGIAVTEHGLYSTFLWSAADQRVRFIHTFPKPPTIWERLSERGRRSLIVDPYFAWCPRTMAGVYLSGWQFEDRMALQGRSRPHRARAELARRYGRPPRLDDVYGRQQASFLHGLRQGLVAAPRRTADAVIGLLGEAAYDLVWVSFSAAHKAGHHLWDPASEVDGPLSEEDERLLRGGLLEVYEAVDTAIGRILAALPDNAAVLVFSPTGMGANTSRADLLPGMLRAVLAGKARTGNGTSGLRTPVWSLRSRVPVGLRSSVARALPDRMVADMTTRLYVRADWEHTRAIAVPGENKGYVRLNLRGREREGIVHPEEADELLTVISEGLATFQDPDGSPAITKVERMSALAGGASYAEGLPDLVVSWGDRPAARLPGVTSPRFGDVTRRGGGSGRSGNHTDDAWAIMLPGDAAVRELGRAMRATDVGATVCGFLDADTTGLSGSSLLEARP